MREEGECAKKADATAEVTMTRSVGLRAKECTK
jgi:hypothetical protein